MQKYTFLKYKRKKNTLFLIFFIPDFQNMQKLFQNLQKFAYFCSRSKICTLTKT